MRGLRSRGDEPSPEGGSTGCVGLIEKGARLRAIGSVRSPIVGIWVGRSIFRQEIGGGLEAVDLNQGSVTADPGDIDSIGSNFLALSGVSMIGCLLDQNSMDP